MDEGFIEPHGLAVWVDDMFMGTAVLVAWARMTGQLEHLEYAAEQVTLPPPLPDLVVLQVRRMTEYLYQGDDGLLHHGFNFWTGHLSCCKWGRGNGWAFVAITEVLAAGEELGLETAELLAMYRRHATGLLAVQGAGGGWSNILTNNQTFVETSSTAMFLTGLSRGLRHGWLEQEEEEVREAVARAWAVVAESVLEDGTMEKVIGGTGIQDTEEQYRPESTEYSKARYAAHSGFLCVSSISSSSALAWGQFSGPLQKWQSCKDEEILLTSNVVFIYLGLLVSCFNPSCLIQKITVWKKLVQHVHKLVGEGEGVKALLDNVHK